jgi:hypothetical protein
MEVRAGSEAVCSVAVHNVHSLIPDYVCVV